MNICHIKIAAHYLDKSLLSFLVQFDISFRNKSWQTLVNFFMRLQVNQKCVRSLFLRLLSLVCCGAVFYEPKMCLPGLHQDLKSTPAMHLGIHLYRQVT